MDDLRLIFVVFCGLLGAALGSFVNVVAIRWHEGVSLRGRSICRSCKKQISPKHLVPILSWIVLRGRCAHCHVRIHPQYVIVEIIAAIFGCIAALRWDPSIPLGSWHILFELVISIGLLVPVVMDFRWQEIPVEYVVCLGIIGLIFRSAFAFSVSGFEAVVSVLIWTVAAICVAFIVLGGQIVASNGRWLGVGDLWLGLGMSGILGLRHLGIAVYFAYILGGCIAFMCLAMGLIKRHSRIPFAPALVAGTLGALWFGDKIGEWISTAFA